MTKVSAYRLTEEIWIDAAPERVFRAWTDPEALRSWWRVPGGYETTDVDIDLRVGGRYRFAGPSEEFGTFEVAGEYRVVERPDRLVFTWSPSWDDGARASVVDLVFQERDGGTRLLVRHSALASAETREDHRTGWGVVLPLVKTYAEGER